MWHEADTVDEPDTPIFVGLLVGDGVGESDACGRLGQRITTGWEVHGAELHWIDLKRVVDKGACACIRVHVTIEEIGIGRCPLHIISWVFGIDLVACLAVDGVALAIRAAIGDFC